MLGLPPPPAPPSPSPLNQLYSLLAAPATLCVLYPTVCGGDKVSGGFPFGSRVCIASVLRAQTLHSGPVSFSVMTYSVISWANPGGFPDSWSSTQCVLCGCPCSRVTLELTDCLPNASGAEELMGTKRPS